MNKLLFLLSFLITSIYSLAQYPNGTQFIGTDSNVVRARGGFQGRFININYADTTAANLDRISQYPGAQIYTSSDNSFWIRNSTATAWLLLNQKFGQPGQDVIANVSRSFNLNGNTFSITNGNWGIKTTPTQTLSIGDDLSGISTLSLYAPNATAAFLQAKSGADLGITSGGSMYLKPNGYSLDGQIVLSATATPGYIVQKYYSGGGSVVGEHGINLYNALSREVEFYLKPFNFYDAGIADSVFTYLTLYNKIRLLNIPNENTASKIIAIDDSSNVRYIDASTISSPTLQQVFDNQSAKAVFNKNDSIDINGHVFSIRNGSSELLRFDPSSNFLWSDGDAYFANGNVALSGASTEASIIFQSGGGFHQVVLDGENASADIELHIPNIFGYGQTDGTLASRINQTIADNSGTVNLGLIDSIYRKAGKDSIFFRKWLNGSVFEGSVKDSIGSGGGVSDFIFTDGNGFDGTVTNSTTTPTLSLTTTVTNQQVLTSNSGAISGSAQFTFTGQALQLASTNTTQTTTGSALSQAYNSLTTGTGQYIASSSLSSGKMLDIQVNSTAASSTGQTGINVLLTGANGTASQTTYAARFGNTHTGTTPSNWSLYTDGGNVGFGTVTATDANHTVIIRGPDNSTNHGLKVLSNNETASATMAWNGFLTSGDNTITSSTGNILTSVLSTKGVGVAITPTSTLSIGGSISTAVRQISALRTLDKTDNVIEVTANTFTVTLPTAAGITGRSYVITNSGSGVTTLSTTGGETFVNVTATPTTLTLNQFNTVTVISNGTNWLRTNSL